MRTITQIKVWKKEDTRIYVSFDSRESGCLYLTGNRWHPKGELEGMTEEEKDAAWQLVQKQYGDGLWHTIWASELETKPLPVSFDYKKSPPSTATVNRYGDYCKRCGRWVEPGLGELSHLTDEEDIDFLGGGNAWILTHLNRTVCDANIAEDAATHAAVEERAAAEKAARFAVLSGAVRVEPFDFAGFAETETGIFVGEVNGVRCAVEIVQFSDGETARFFYCADPAAAGLTPKTFDGSIESSFSEFFGD